MKQLAKDECKHNYAMRAVGIPHSYGCYYCWGCGPVSNSGTPLPQMSGTS